MNNKKILLAIDTVSPEASLTLWKEGKSWSVAFGEMRTYSQNLITLFDRLVKKAKVSAENIAGIHVITGPGSYTSARIGVTFANALAFSNHIPVFGETLFVVLQRAYPDADVIAVDAGRGNAFVAQRDVCEVVSWAQLSRQIGKKRGVVFARKQDIAAVVTPLRYVYRLDRAGIFEALLAWLQKHPSYPSFTSPYYLLPPHLTVSKKRSPFAPQSTQKRKKK